MGASVAVIANVFLIRQRVHNPTSLRQVSQNEVQQLGRARYTKKWVEPAAGVCKKTGGFDGFFSSGESDVKDTKIDSRGSGVGVCSAGQLRDLPLGRRSTAAKAPPRGEQHDGQG